MRTLLSLGGLRSTDRERPLFFLPVIVLALCGAPAVKAQTFVNGDFESGTTGWSGCIQEIGTLPTYGGTGTGHVAEVDGNFSTSSTDDRILCQTVTGFTVGSIYALSFDATRRGTGTPPTTVSVTVKASGSDLNATVTRTGAWSMVRERITFVASQTSLGLTITPNFEGSYGMIFDNFAINLVSALPIELVGFNAHAEGGSVHLEWATASESDNAYFQVERSSDNDTWTVVDQVPGAGQSQELLNYTAMDAAPMSGQSYYRLKQVDFDGASTYSATRAVSVAPAKEDVHLWPNPARERVMCRAEGFAPVGFLVTDATGRAVMDRNGLAPVQDLVVEVGALEPGSYALQLRDASGHTKGRRFVVE